MRRPSAADANSIFVCGIHAVAAMLRAHRATQLYVAQGSPGARLQEVLAAAAAAQVPIRHTPRQELARLSGETHHQNIVAQATLPQATWEEVLHTPAPLVVCDGITDPRNLGAVLRVARAFGAAAVVGAARRAAPLTAAAQRAAAGAAAHIPLVRVTNLSRALQQLDAAGRTIYAASEEGEESVFAAPMPPDVCWVLGDEGSGIRRLVREHCHRQLRIPTTAGEGGCLNVATACAVCLAATAAQNRK